MSLATYDVEALRVQPAGTIMFVIDGKLLDRDAAVRVLNPRPAYMPDGPSNRLLDSAARYAVPALVNLAGTSWTLVPEATTETPAEIDARLLAIIARCKAGYR